MQETHFTSDLISKITSEFDNWKCYHSYGESNAKGCSIIISNKINFNIIDSYIDTNGRYVLLNIEALNNVFSLLNIYAPNDKKLRTQFFEILSNELFDKAQGLKVIGGDFNDVLKERDRIYKQPTRSKFKINEGLNQLIKRHSLVDIWGILNKDTKHFTWRRKNSIEKSRIDYWLIDTNMSPVVLGCDIRPASIQHTDHQAISLKIKSPIKRGQGYWKLNNSLLSDITYKNNILKIFDKCTRLDLNDILKWEVCKHEIKEFSQKYSIQQSRKRNNTIQQLEKQLKDLYANNNASIREIAEIETQIANFYDFKSKGAQIRSRDRNSKYFLNL